MTITSTNFTDISYVPEVTPGVIPDGGVGTPTDFQILPTVSGAPAFNITTAVSEVIRSDRQTDDLVVVDAEVTGDVDYELSYTPYRPLLEALLRGTLQTDTPVAGSDTMRNGNNIAQTYSFCKRVLGITDTAYFFYNGCAISQMVFNFETGAILTGVMSVYGRTEEANAESEFPSTYLTEIPNFITPPAYNIMNSVQNVVTTITGLPAGTEYSALNLTINNNTTGAKAIGTLGSVDTADFTLDITGDISLYFQDLAAYQLFLQSSNFALSAVLTDGAGNELTINLPYNKFETLDTPIPGKDNFFMLEGSLRALRDPVNDYMVEFIFKDA